MTFVDILYRRYRSQPASFPSPYTTEVAIQRLSSMVQRPTWAFLLQEGLVGKVTPTRVNLYRNEHLFFNSFSPVFTGKFTLHNGVTVLAGNFSMARGAKIFMPVWFSGLAAFAFLNISFGIAQDEPLPLMFLLGLCAMGVGGIAITFFGCKDSSNDEAYISEAIRSGIGDGNAG